MKFKTKIVLGFGAALIILACVAIFSYKSFLTDEADRAWVAHTYEVMEKLDNLLADLTTAESGERGFIITGDEQYLEDYAKGASQIEQDLREVRSLTADNAKQQLALDSSDPLIRLRLEQFAERIKLRRQQISLNKVISLPKDGKPVMDKLRVRIAAMKAEERLLLERRVNAATASSRKTRSLIILGNALALSFLLFAGWVIRNEIEQRRKAEEEVRELNAGLEQRVAERTAELQAREQDLTRSNAELQQFAYVASHDLQEPLRMVASFTQLLARRYGDKLDNDAREFIAYAVDGATRMQTLIGDLLTYSRVGTQMKAFERTSCDAVLDQVLKALKVAITETHAVITRDPMPVVMGDRSQLGQLFQNLLSNALKFHGAGEPRIHISAEKNGTAWKFSVRDNGIGIPREHEDRIFVIFQRLHTKVEYPGTGIGLAICKKIAERHGGRIWIESSSAEGTTFCFTIAAATPMATKEGANNVYGIRTGSN